MKAVTLLETLIVMGILAALLGFSMVGLTGFQATIELQNSYSDIATVFETLQNRARNSIATSQDVSGNKVTPDYYSVFFDNGDYTFYQCLLSGENVACSVDLSISTPPRSDDIKITSPQNCRGIGFKRLTVDIVTIDQNGAIDTTGTCQITILHQGTNESKRINVSVEGNSFSLE